MEWWTHEYWSESYKSGRWDYLWSDEQLKRYQLIQSWCRHIGTVSLLDVGCGEGVLLRDLPPGKIRSYLGLDFSSTAIKSASFSWKEHPFAKFEVYDAEKLTERNWQPYDTIVFNEILYSLHNPAELLDKVLNEQAPVMPRFVITSVYYKQERLQKTIRKLFRKNLVEEENAIFNQVSGGWYLLLLKNNFGYKSNI